MNLKNKKVLVVGMGLSGQAAARFLIKQKAEVTLNDKNDQNNIDFSKDVLLGKAYFKSGDLTRDLVEKQDLVIVSPGVPPTLPFFTWAQKKKIPILGEMGLAALFLKTPMIAVTGTNGKSTTVTVMYEVLKRAGRRVALAGNIGKPLIEVVMQKKKLDYVVVEVSSYQLETVKEFHPRVSMILNITADHLDRYPSMKEYAEAKFRIFKEQKRNDLFIYNDHDVWIRKGLKKVKAQKIAFGRDLSVKGWKIIFPQRKESYSLNRVRLLGVHQEENMMAVIAAARFLKIPQKVIQKTLETFKGLPHRTEFVRKKNGVSFYDDSKATNVDAVLKALEGFCDRRVILIAGGRDKGGAYAPLKPWIQKKVKHLLLIGEAAPLMKKEFEKSSPMSLCDSLDQAVRKASQISEAGDVVLLSPACSSFDQFKDYKERGDVFQKAVCAL